METLNTELEIRPLFSILIFGILVFIVISLALLGVQIFREHRYQIFSKNIAKFEKNMFDFLADQNQTKIELPKTKYLRNLIVKLAKQVAGADLEGLRTLYVNLGFYAADIVSLNSFWFGAKVGALARCRILQFPLDNQLWKKILEEKNHKFVWASLEYLTIVKRGKAFSWIIGILVTKPDFGSGIIKHILANIAIDSSSMIYSLLVYTDDLRLREILFNVISLYPAFGNEKIIVEEALKSTDEKIIISAIKASAAIPSLISMELVLNFVNHPNWNVREAVAESLKNYDESEAIKALAELCTDSSFIVRKKAVAGLFQSENLSNKILCAIASDINHPSFPIFVEFKSKNEKMREAA